MAKRRIEMLYHKIETIYNRDPKSYKVIEGELRKELYSLISKWEFTEKIDGTNIRVIWQDGQLSFGGRTENAQIPAQLVNWLNENISADKLRDIFPDKSVIIYGEGYGAAIQNGHGYSPVQKFIVFDVLVGGKWWLTRNNVCDVSSKLGLDVVPFVGNMSLEEAVVLVKSGTLKSQIGDGSVYAEGLIGRTSVPLFEANGDRVIIKIKTQDFS
jgi:hypothetical protein